MYSSTRELYRLSRKRWLDYQLAGPDNLIENRDQYGEMYYTITDDVVEKINAWYRGRAYIYDNSFIDMAVKYGDRNAAGND